MKKNTLDNWIGKAKNNKIITIILVIFFIVVNLGIFTDSLSTIYNFACKLTKKTDENVPNLTLRSATISQGEKLKDGQYNFDIKFKVANFGNREATKLECILFLTDNKERVEKFNIETNETLPSYRSSKREDMYNLNNCSSNYLSNYPYCVLFIKYVDEKDGKEYSNIFYRKIFIEKKKNILNTNLIFVSRKEEQEINKLLSAKDYNLPF